MLHALDNHIVHFQQTIEDSEKRLNSSNTYFVSIIMSLLLFFFCSLYIMKKLTEIQQFYITVKLKGIIAKIAGPSPTSVMDNELLTLDASQSSNPNENHEKDKKTNLLYTWNCNVIEDSNCKKITTSGTVIYLQDSKFVRINYTFYRLGLIYNKGKYCKKVLIIKGLI